MNRATFHTDVGIIPRYRYCSPIDGYLFWGPAIGFRDVDDRRHEAESFVKDCTDQAVVQVAHVDLVVPRCYRPRPSSFFNVGLELHLSRKVYG